jgi:hypothetical protein
LKFGKYEQTQPQHLIISKYHYPTMQNPYSTHYYQRVRTTYISHLLVRSAYKKSNEDTHKGKTLTLSLCPLIGANDSM